MATNGNVITTIAMGGEDKLLSPKRKRTGRPTSLKKTNVAANMAQMTESLEDDMSPSTSPGTSNPIGSPIKSRRYKAPIDKQQLQGQLQNGITLKTFPTATDSLNSISNCTSMATTREGATTPPQSPSLFSTSFATRSHVSNSTTSDGHDDGERNSSSSSLFSPESFVRGTGRSGGMMMQDTDHMRQGVDGQVQMTSSSSSSSSSEGNYVSGTSMAMTCDDDTLVNMNDRLHDAGMGGVHLHDGDEDGLLLRRPSSDSTTNVLGDISSADGRDEGITIMKSDYSPFRPTSSSKSSSVLANTRAHLNTTSSSSSLWQQRISGEGGMVDVRGGAVPSSSSGSMYSKRIPSFTCPGSENLRPPLRNSEDEWRSQGSSFEEGEEEGESDDEKSSVGSPGARRSRRLKFSPGGLMLPSREGVDDDEAESQHDNSDFAGRLSALHVGKTKSRTLFSDAPPTGGQDGIERPGGSRHHHHSHGDNNNGGIANNGMFGGSRLQDDLNGSEYSTEHGGGDNYHQNQHHQQHHDHDHIRNRPPHLFARTGQRNNQNGSGGNSNVSYQHNLPIYSTYQHNHQQKFS